jgi:hypothetical protein
LNRLRDDCHHGIGLVQSLRVEKIRDLVRGQNEEPLAVRAELPRGDVIRKSELVAFFQRLQIVNIYLPGFVLEQQNARRGRKQRTRSKQDRFLLSG